MATLGYHLRMCRAIFGEDSPATAFLERKVQESPNGENEEVIAPESQVVALLGSLHVGGNKDLYKEVRWTN